MNYLENIQLKHMKKTERWASKRQACRLLHVLLADGVVGEFEFVQFQLLRCKGIEYSWVEDQRALFNRLDVSTQSSGAGLDIAELKAWDPAVKELLSLMEDKPFMDGGLPKQEPV